MAARLGPDVQKKSICVVGICTVDAVARCIDEYPPPGGLRIFDSLKLTTGGNAVNGSIALAKMGFAVSVVTKIGEDQHGQFVLDELDRHGVDTSGVVRSADTHTPFSFVCVHSDGQRSFLHTVGTNGTLRREEMDRTHVCRADLCLVTGTMLMPQFDARNAGAITLLDTSLTDAASAAAWRTALEPCLPHLDFFVPSRMEAAAFTGHEEPSRAAEAILAGGCRNAVIKLDTDGVYYRTEGGREGTIPAYRVARVVDTTGAGDCWCAGLLAGLAQDLPLEDSLRLGNAVAAHCIQHAGASSGIPPLEHIQRFQRSPENR